MSFATQLSAAFTPIAAVYDDSSVTRALTWAQSFVETYCDQTFDFVSGDVAVLDPKPYRSALIPKVPVTAVTQVLALLPPQIGSAPLLSQSLSGSGGSWTAGTYFWAVTAVTPYGESVKSNQVSAALTSAQSNVLSWTSVTGATGYKVYRGAMANVQNVLVASVTGTTYTDTGVAGTSAVPPTGLTWTPLPNFAFVASTGLIYDTTGEPGTPAWQSGSLSWPSVKGGLKVTYDHGYSTVPQGLVDVACRLAQQYLENPTLVMHRRVGDSEARFSGSSGVSLNHMDETILGRYVNVGIA